MFDRLSVLDFRTTPLREKREDRPGVISHRLAAEWQRNGRKSPYRIEEEAVRLLVTHDWPGNVRELQNVIARLTARVSDDEAITVEDVRRVLPAAKKQTLHLVQPNAADGRQVLPESLMYREEGETIREYLSRAFVAVAEKTLEEHGGCLTDAGVELGVNRSNLRTRLREARLIVKERELRISRDVADAA